MKLIIGNWKMFPQTATEAKRIIAGIKKVAKKAAHIKVVVCPPQLLLVTLAAQHGSAKLAIGGQDAFWENEGAFTGETSPATLRSLGATYVILGHSERRALGETDTMVARKAVQAIRNKLTVVLCVGEHSRDEGGGYFNEVREELRGSLAGVPKAEAKRLVVAYEPIWAIGTKAVRPATPADFHEMSILIRRHLVEQFGKSAGFKIPILYGGSVDERNARGFLKDAGADGLLIGRVSLDPQKFGNIITIANGTK